MEDILKRDITGECVGECRNIVRQGYSRRQVEINALGGEWPDTYPSVAGATSRNEPPGFLGGHV